MLSYGQIVKTSYIVTIKNPLLWLFGLFVVGGFNLNFLYFQDVLLHNLQGKVRAGDVLRYLGSHPGIFTVLTVLTLLVVAGLLILTSWCRIMLTCCTKEALDNKPLAVSQQLKKSFDFLWPVIKVSFLTSALMIVAGVGLLGAPFWLIKNQANQSILWTSGLVFLIPLAFTISSVNIFTVFFVILLRQPFGKALDLGTDFFVANWVKILGLSAVLMVIYSASFAGGAGVIFLAKGLFRFLGEFLGQMGISGLSLVFFALQALTGLLLWVLFAGLNVFFNTALLLLFMQLTTPIEADKEKGKEILPLPASSSV